MKKYIAPEIKTVVIPMLPLLAGSDTIEFTNQRGDNTREVLTKESGVFCYEDEDDCEE